MSYSAVEAKVLAVLKLHGSYNDNNASRGNWSILNSGRSDRYVVLRMGPAVNEQHTPVSALTTYQTELLVYRLYTEDGTSAVLLQGYVQEVIAHMEKYPTLQGTVTDAQITNISAMEQIAMVANGPQWLRTTITLQWQEEREIDYV